jgi:hypothetical protein
MSYLRDPRNRYCWQSDGEWNGQYKAADGTLYKCADEADKHDLELNQHPWFRSKVGEHGN